MKKVITILLQAVTVLITIGTIVFLIWEPLLEGRNANATLTQVYFNDPFLACVYVASIAYFIGLYQVFKLLEYVRQNNIYSLNSIKALRTIKYCAVTLITLLLFAELYLFLIQRTKDDIAGGVAMGLFLIFIFTIVASISARFEKKFKNRLDIKTEDNLVV